MKKILIFGSFDIIHPGHLYLIEQAKKLGQLYVCLALDETIQKVKEREPYNNLESRIKNLELLDINVLPGDAQDRLKVVRQVKPDIVMLGYDQKAFVDQLETYVTDQKLNLKIIRLQPFHAEFFSSSKIRKVLEDPQAGFIMIDKPSGQPSMRTISDLRKTTKIKRIGFAGTLDPLASGLLICGISKATTLLDWWHFFPKTYEVTAKLGFISDTYDSEGSIEKKSDHEPARAQLAPVLNKFSGNIEQEPPMFSAKKHKGKKLYELARQGQVVDRKKQLVTIHKLELIDFHYPEIRLRVECSSGTYVRSLVHDVGKELGVGAIVTSLRRTKIGPSSVKSAVKLKVLSDNQIKKYFLDINVLRKRLNKHLFPKFC